MKQIYVQQRHLHPSRFCCGVLTPQAVRTVWNASRWLVSWCGDAVLQGCIVVVTVRLCMDAGAYDCVDVMMGVIVMCSATQDTCITDVTYCVYVSVS